MDEINELTITDTGSAEVINEIKLSKTRPFVVKPQEYFEPKRSVFNRIVVDSNLEMRFAQFLDQATDVVSFAKNTQGVHFFIEYVNHSGDIRHYYPDFVVKVQQDDVYVVETKGLQDLDVLPKWLRLVQWCEDASQADSMGRIFYPVFLSGSDFDELEKAARSMRQIAEAVKGRGPVGS
jgi:type III restriction enzyme